MDIDAIALGEDFVEAIETTVAKCDVLIAVIGNNWLTSKDDRGDRRLDNPEDFVRMEIGSALKRKIRVMPVLVDGALMPRSTELPEDLRPLVRRNALSITDTSFDGDCQRLAAAIRLVLEKVQQERAEGILQASGPVPNFFDSSAKARGNERATSGKVSPNTAPSHEPAQSGTPPFIENRRREQPKLFMRLGLLMARLRVQLTICAMILIVSGVWIAGLKFNNGSPKAALPMPIATASPTPTRTPNPQTEFDVGPYPNSNTKANPDLNSYNNTKANPGPKQSGQ